MFSDPTKKGEQKGLLGCPYRRVANPAYSVRLCAKVSKSYDTTKFQHHKNEIKMAKLKDTEVLTKQVYLNIKRENEVETKQMRTAEALKVYGDKEVVFMYEPRYSEERECNEPDVVKKARKAGLVEDDKRKAGVTDIILA